MAFLDKLNTFTKNVSDKANDVIELTKLNSKINSEKAEIDGLLKKIGSYYYEKHMAGEAVDSGIAEMIAAVDAHNAAIRETEAQIKALKEEPAAAAPAAAAPIGGIVCPSCGKQNVAGTKFCSECGGKLEAPVQPQQKVCPSCGAAVAEGIKFCSECGTKVE
jgi:predicted nucleic acid-binding Zn ribbon protein